MESIASLHQSTTAQPNASERTPSYPLQPAFGPCGGASFESPHRIPGPTAPAIRHRRETFAAQEAMQNLIETWTLNVSEGENYMRVSPLLFVRTTHPGQRAVAAATTNHEWKSRHL